MDPPNAQNSHRSRAAIFAAGAAIAVAPVAAYHNSFAGPFTFDDQAAIVDNPTIRHLWPIWRVLRPPAIEGIWVRPLVNLSFAVNRALGGLNVWGYHATNLLIHILAGLTLFGIVRRTLDMGWLAEAEPLVVLRPPSSAERGLRRGSLCPLSRRQRLEAHATFLAFAVALIWTVHPLQTEAITYISQRSESLMGLFFLLTLYFFIRSTDQNSEIRNSKFEIFSVVFCLCGMAAKEVMVVAPLLVLLYDRTFVSGTFVQALRRRWKYYLGLAGTWLLLAYTMTDLYSRGATLNHGESRWAYALMESRVIVRYLGLALWPHPLIIDYGRGVSAPTWAVAPFVAVILLLLGISAWLLFRNPKSEVRNLMGFAGAWFFLLLAPTSSVVPVAGQPMAEHRLYLPLAAVVAVVVIGGYAAIISNFEIRNSKFAFISVLAAAAVACGCLTVRRNRDYHTELALWGKTAAQAPGNPRALYNFGMILSNAGDTDAAIKLYRRALQLQPDYPDARNNLGIALADTNHWDEAIGEYKSAIRIDPDFAKAYYNLGNAYSHLGQPADAAANFEVAVRLSPDDPSFVYNLGNALRQLGKLSEAGARYEQALRLKPDFPKARNNLGNVRRDTGHLPEAIVQYREAVQLKPDYVDALLNLGGACAALGRNQEAADWYGKALRLEPNNVAAHDNRGIALAQTGRAAQAAEEFEAATRLEPDNPEIHYNLGCALAQLGRTSEARAQFETALRLKPDDPATRATLARLPNF